MTSPAANRPLATLLGCIGTITTVDTVTGVCGVDVGDGAPITEVLYLGPAPKVGAQVAVIAIQKTLVALGGTG